MQVTEEDGGRLNAFAKEPRMQVMEAGESSSSASRWLLIGGALLVVEKAVMGSGVRQVVVEMAEVVVNAAAPLRLPQLQ